MAIQLVYPKRNDALGVNPPAGDAHITTNASDWLWTVFALMLVSWFITMGWAYSNRRHSRIFHYIPLIVLGVSTVAYFAMASDLGWALIRSEFRSHSTRQIWYARYIQWFINAPLILLALLALTSLATVQILTILFFSWFYVVNGLFGAFTASSYKWGFFVFGLFGLFFIWAQLLFHVPFRHGAWAHNDFKDGYFLGAGYISFIWMVYPICWGLSEGSNTISPTAEMVFYGILDLLAAPVFLLGYMAFVKGFDLTHLRTTAFGTAARGEEADQDVPQKGPAPPASGSGQTTNAGTTTQATPAPATI